MKKYQIEKHQVRELAINWQHTFSDEQFSYDEWILFTELFYLLGRKYGLVNEFKENGII